MSSKINHREKIICIDQYSYVGGGQTIFLDSLRCFQKNGMQLVVIIPTGGELERRIWNVLSSEDVLIPCKDTIIVNKNLPIKFLKIIFCNFMLLMDILLKLEKPKYIYVNGPRQFLAVAIVSILLNVKCIYHIHIKFSNLQKLFLKIIAKLSQTYAIIVNSRYIYDETYVRDSTEEINKKLVLIENAVSQQYFQIDNQASYQAASIERNVVVFGMIGIEKGQELIVKCASDFPQKTFFIVGRDADGQEEWVYALKARAPKNVVFTGPISDLQAFVSEKKVSISVVPSQWDEPFGLVALESMMMSCLTIVSGRGGLREIAHKTGAIRFTNQDNLVSLLREVFEMEPSEFQKVINEQYSNVGKYYSPYRYCGQLIDLLRDFRKS